MPEVVAKPRTLYFLQGILPVDRGRLGSEAFAGLTLAALAIPEVMGYTRIAGMPVVTGLYTLLIPLALFGLLGSSLKLKNHVLHIPSAFNFLVMKLNATRVNRLRHIASIALTNNG